MRQEPGNLKARGSQTRTGPVSKTLCVVCGRVRTASQGLPELLLHSRMLEALGRLKLNSDP